MSLVVNQCCVGCDVAYEKRKRDQVVALTTMYQNKNRFASLAEKIGNLH